jgi:RNA 2',3'-cyclic 3'-phosphodiesterase
LSGSQPDISSQLAPSTLRLFCALELPEEVRARAAEHIERLRSRVPEVRASWERAEKMHITLKFLGEIRAEQVEAVTLAATRAARQAHPFKLACARAGAFPPRGNPRVLWLGLEDSGDALAQLQNRLEEECEAAGFARAERPFHPHLTVARIRAPQGARQLVQAHQQMGFEAIEFAVTDLVVMRSELGPGGSRYTEMSRHAFGA